MLESALKSVARTALRRFAPGVLVNRHLRQFGADEIECQLLELIAPHGRDAIDVGANWGVYARKLSLIAREVHCLEPNPELAQILRRTLASNCHVIEAAACDSASTATLYMPLDGLRIVDGLASLRPLRDADLAAIKVRTTPLDDFAEQPVGFVKIDVEGAEMSVLAGAERLIAAQKPHMLVEIEERHRAGAIDEARGWFKRRGYEGWFINDGQVVAIEDFDAATLQDATRFDSTGVRRAQRYVNNFLFMPAGAMTPAIRTAIRNRLAALNLDATQDRVGMKNVA